MHRWTITRAAAFLHREVLQPVGYARRGTSCWREDFLVRRVTFSAQRFLPPEERTLAVGFSLEWSGIETPRLPEWAHTGVGATLSRQYVQPRADESRLDPALISAVAGPVLDYLEAPTSPIQFIDELLDTGPEDDPDLWISVSPLVRVHCAAWGSLTLEDAGRCAHALRMSKQLAEAAGRPEWHRDQRALIDQEWRRRHGRPRPQRP